MEVFFGWIALSIAVGVWASKKGRSGFGWFVFSTLLSPLIGAVFVAIASDNSQEAQEKAVSHITHVRCPDCRELVRKDARKCKHCGTKLIPDDD
jgi:hypothetical protein